MKGSAPAFCQSTEALTLKQINPVNFLIVGTGRAGTTTLYEILRRHPGIFIPRKECGYFSNPRGNFGGYRAEYANAFTPTLESYVKLFRQAKPGQLCGDISPAYLYYHQVAVPKILAETHDQLPIIIILRNPIDRAYSRYMFNVSTGRETLSFEETIEQEAKRKEENWPVGRLYTDAGYYAKPVKAYTDAFSNVLILLYERDVVSNQAEGKILKFLGLAPSPHARKHIRANISGLPRYPLLHRWMTSHSRVIRGLKDIVRSTFLYDYAIRVYRSVIETNLEKTKMKAETRVMLKDRFADDVALLARQTRLPLQEYWTDFQP